MEQLTVQVLQVIVDVDSAQQLCQPLDQYWELMKYSWKRPLIVASHKVEWADKPLSGEMAWCLVHWTLSHYRPKFDTLDGRLPFYAVFSFSACVTHPCVTHSEWREESKFIIRKSDMRW